MNICCMNVPPNQNWIGFTAQMFTEKGPEDSPGTCLWGPIACP